MSNDNTANPRQPAPITKMKSSNLNSTSELWRSSQHLRLFGREDKLTEIACPLCGGVRTRGIVPGGGNIREGKCDTGVRSCSLLLSGRLVNGEGGLEESRRLVLDSKCIVSF